MNILKLHLGGGKNLVKKKKKKKKKDKYFISLRVTETEKDDVNGIVSKRWQVEQIVYTKMKYSAKDTLCSKN